MKPGSNSWTPPASVVHGFARQFYYRNPFWDDQTDPLTDETILIVARLSAPSFSRRRFRMVVSWILYVGLWALFILILAKWLKALMLLELALFGALVLPFPLILYAWVRAATKRLRGASAAAHGASVRRYHADNEQLRFSDPALHAQIMLWHQGEVQIAMAQQQANLQRMQFVLQSQQLQAQRQTNRRTR